MTKLAALSALVAPVRGADVAQYHAPGAADAEACGNGAVGFLALAGWILAVACIAWCLNLVMKSGSRKRLRTIGIQTVATFRRHYKHPRMDNLNDGEHGTWVD